MPFQRSSTLLATVCLLLVLTKISYGARLLLCPADVGSHVRMFTVTGKHLKQAGHEVYLLTVHKHKSAIEKAGINHILLKPKLSRSVGDNYDIVEAAVWEQGLSTTIQLFHHVTGSIFNQTVEMLQSDDIMAQLFKLNFDLALIDGFFPYRSILLIPYKLNIPFTSICVINDPWLARVASLPSLEALHAFGVQLTKDSTIVDRTINFILTVGFNSIKGYLIPMHNDASIVQQYVPERPAITMEQIYMLAEMWLINLDIICLDWPRVSAPHYQFVGGMAMEPAQPLPKDMTELMNTAEDGVIIVTFGLHIKRVKMDMLQKMLGAFAQFPRFQFIMRHDGELPESMPDNVYLAKWLPQSDLLGHPKTKIFITHGGNNGQMEALYHGVPMIAFPFTGDQTYNADRIVSHQFGKRLNHMDFTTAELASTIQELLSNPVYTDNIKRCSAISKHLPSGASQMLMWVDFVLKFGGSHLKPPGLNMPMYQVLMLDVLLLLLLLLCIAIAVIYTSCKICWKICCHPKQKTE